MDKRTGKVIEENPEYILQGESAIVKMVPKRAMVCEAYTEFPPLGRFAVRDMNMTVAVGVIKETTKKEAQKTK